MNIETLKSWYSFYTNEGVYNRSFETFITEIKTNKSLYEKFIKMPKSTTSGIKFYGDDDYGFNQINFFTLIAIIHIFNKNYDFTKNRKIIIGFSHDSPKIQKLKDFLIRFLNRNKFQVFIHNANFVSEFLINETAKTWDIKNGIYLNYDENTNKYYLKIYYNNHEISIEEQKSFIAELLHFKSNIVLGKIKEHQTLNIDKIINFYSEKLIKDNIEKLQKITKKPSFTVYTLISNAETSYILNKILVNAGFKVHKLSQIYKNLHNLNEANFNFFKAFKINSYKADIFIFINSFNELKIYVKTKNKYVLLNEEDLIFLYINNYYLTWKKIGILNKNKIYIPFYASKNIFNLFYRFSIPYEKNEDISNNNVLLSYSDNKFSNNLYNNLDYNNIPFIVRFCFILYNYKINNNLFDYKYKKMKETNKNVFLLNDNIKMDYNISLEVVNSYFEGDKIYHKNSIIKIKKLDQKSQNEHNLLEVKIGTKKWNFLCYLFFNFKKNSLVTKAEIELNNESSKFNRIINKIKFWWIFKQFIKNIKQLKNPKKG